MASEREAAKNSIVEKDQDDPELDDAFSAAHRAQLYLLRENNRHAEQMQAQQLGFFGKFFGGKETLPTYIALVLALMGFLGTAYAIGVKADWSPTAEKLLAFTSACVAFIFGRASKD